MPATSFNQVCSLDLHALRFVFVDLVAILERPVIKSSSGKTQNTALHTNSHDHHTWLVIFPTKPIRGPGINNDTFCFTMMSQSEELTSLFLFNREFSLSPMQYKETFTFLWQRKAFLSITKVMANEQRRKICSFSGMKCKNVLCSTQQDHGHI